MEAHMIWQWLIVVAVSLVASVLAWTKWMG